MATDLADQDQEKHHGGGHDDEESPREEIFVAGLDDARGKDEGGGGPEGGVLGEAFGNDPMGAGIDALETVGGCETNICGRPDVLWRCLAKEAFVALLGAGIPIVEFRGFGVAALGRAVVEGFAENVAAQVIPVGAGVNEVKVPGLVDFIRGRDGMAGDGGEVDEAQVFVDDALGEGFGPVVFAGEPLGEGELSSRGVDLQGLKSQPEGIVFHSHGIGISWRKRGFQLRSLAEAKEFLGMSRQKVAS